MDASFGHNDDFDMDSGGLALKRAGRFVSMSSVMSGEMFRCPERMDDPAGRFYGHGAWHAVSRCMTGVDSKGVVPVDGNRHGIADVNKKLSGISG